MTELCRRDPIELAESIHRTSLFKRPPVDVYAVCERLGIELYVSSNLRYLHSVGESRGSSRIAWLNEALDEASRRYAAARALGRFELCSSRHFADDGDVRSSSSEEARAADELALNLLVPLWSLEHITLSSRCSTEAIAERFQVPSLVVRRQLARLL